MFYEATWFVSALRAARRSGADVVIGVVPSLSGGMLALLAAKQNRAPLGLIIQDLMGPAAAQSGYRGGRLVAGITGVVENFVLRRCDRVAVVSEAFRANLVRAGVADSQIHSVRNWTRASEPTESVADCRRRLGWAPDDFVCLHAGNMGKKQGLDNLLDAASLIADRRIRIVLAGDGNDRLRLEALVRARQLRNVSFLPLQPSGQYEAMLQAADVLLVSQRPSVADMSLPSKLTAYFSAGRPVLAAVAPDCATAKEVEESGAGVVVPSGDEAALSAAISCLKNSEVEVAYGRRGKEYAEQHLTPSASLSAFDAFAALLPRPRLPIHEALSQDRLPTRRGGL